MTSVFDKLKLRPFERRLVVIIGIVLFLVAQFIFVWPHFGAITRMDARRAGALKTLKQYNDEFAQTNKIRIDLGKVENDGSTVPLEESSSDLMRNVQTHSAQLGVQIQNVSKPFTRTNGIFLEQSLQVTAVSTEDSLLNYLYTLGSGNSLIRVRDLTLRPDQTRTKLNASIKLVASYQKNRTPARPVPIAGAAPVTRPPGPPAAGPAGQTPSTPLRKSP